MGWDGTAIDYESTCSAYKNACFFTKSGKIRTTLQISADKHQMSDLLSKALFRDKKNERV